MKNLVRVFMLIGMAFLGWASSSPVWAQDASVPGFAPEFASQQKGLTASPSTELVCDTLYVNDPASNLHIVDETTGNATLIGPIGISNVTDIAFDGSTLYGITSSQFLTIDPLTGSGTTVGHTGASLNALAVDSTGTIYAAGSSNLFTINSGTGAATLVGNFGTGISDGDLAFDSADNLYALISGRLAQVDTGTGAATTIGLIGFSNTYGIAFLGGTLYGATQSGQIIQIDTATGAGTLIGNSGVTQWGMASYQCTCVQPPTGMVAWYPFDNNLPFESFLAWDIQGLHNGTKQNGPTVAPGMVQNALQFNGVNQFVNVSHHNDFNFGTGDFSFDTWVRFPSGHSGIHPILQKHNSSGLLNGYHWFVKDGQMALQMTSNGTAQVYFSGVSLVNDGQWHLLAVTVKRGTNGGRWYIDGNQVGTPFTPLSGSINNTAPLQLGKYTTIPTGEYHLNGILDEVEIFNRALGAAEVQSIYDAGEYGKCKDPCPYLVAISQNKSDDGHVASDAVNETRALRDQVWSKSAAGRHMTAVYGQHSSRVTSLLLRDAELSSQVAKILWQLQPAIRSLTSEEKERFIVTEELVEGVRATLHYLQKADATNKGGILAEAIDRELSIVNPEKLVGLSAEEAWSQVVQQYDESMKTQAEEVSRDGLQERPER